MVKGRTTLIALAAALLIPGAARPARADQAGDDRDRAVVAHSRDRSVVRARPAASGPEAPVSAPPAVQDPQLLCDRPCLQAVADSYLKAVVAHDPKLLALDDHVRFTENGQELLPGDGFWNTASGVGRPSSSTPIPRRSRSPMSAPCANSTTWCCWPCV